jgi:hypothetical protein
MSILWTIIIGFVAGVIAKFIMPGPNEPSGFTDLLAVSEVTRAASFLLSLCQPLPISPFAFDDWKREVRVRAPASVAELDISRYTAPAGAHGTT